MDNFLECTIGGLLSDVAKRLPKQLAVKYTDRDYERTYAELDREAEVIAKGFLKAGIKKGDHVAIWATNIPEWLLTLFAAAKIGAVLVTVNTNYKVYELEYLMKQSDSAALVMMGGFKDSDYVKIVNDLIPDLKEQEPGNINSGILPFLRTVIYAGDETPAGMLNFRELYALSEKCTQEEYDAVSASLNCHETINMQYTSGTTGFPKGVMLSHYNILNNGKSIGDCMKFTEKDKLCITVPFFHCFGLVLAITASITHAASMVPIDAYHPIKVMKAIESEKCTAVHGVPTMFIAMLEHGDFGKYDFSSLRTGIMAGSPCPVKVMQDVADKMNMRDITIVYGQTEASPGCTQTTTDDSLERRVSTVGRALPGIECKVVDPATGKEAGTNVTGEFCARGYNIMKGYYKMPEATANAIDTDGWLHTGDLVTVDGQGYYKITGRMKDMIIRGGENIYPMEIEDFLYTNPKIKDVQVIGVPSEAYGEEIMAYVILKAGETADEDEIKDFVKANMARHKTPRYVKFVDSFPMTASGKIQKFKMREEAIEELGLNDADSVETA
jgi:fatty-acyl-CoA synthase